MELRNALSARYNLDLPSTVIFDYPTVAALAAFIAGKLAAAEQPAAGAGGYDAEPAATVNVSAIRCLDLATFRMHAWMSCQCSATESASASLDSDIPFYYPNGSTKGLRNVPTMHIDF